MASLQAGAWWPSSSTRAQNQSSGDASTSPAVLCERARRPSRLSGDGSLHWVPRQNTGTSRRIEPYSTLEASGECTASFRSPGGRTAAARGRWH